MKDLEALRQETGEAMRRTEAERQGGGALPRVGDLYALPQTAEHPVEWAVLEHDQEGNRFLAVPADTMPLLGSGDVEVPASEPGGPLALRCRHAVWLAAVTLWNGTRTGGLSGSVAARALETQRLARAGKLTASAEEEEIEEDVEYREWVRGVLAPAAVSLSQSRVVAAQAALSHTLYSRVVFQVAASALLVVVGFGAGLFHQHQTAQSLQGRLEALQESRLDLTEAILFKSGEPLRSGPQEILLKGPHIALRVFLPLLDTDSGTYRLRIVRNDDGREISSIEIPESPEARRLILLSTRGLSPGLHQFILYADGTEVHKQSLDLVEPAE